MIVPTLCPPWQQFIERGGVFKNLYRLRFRDGQYHWVASSGVSLTEKDGTIREWIGTFNDITGRKRAEEALRQKEEEYRSIFEQALEGIYRTTPEGKSLAANPALAKILGYTSTEELEPTSLIRWVRCGPILQAARPSQKSWSEAKLYVDTN